MRNLCQLGWHMHRSGKYFPGLFDSDTRPAHEPDRVHLLACTYASNMSADLAGSQVCNLSWSKNVNEIVSTHGYSQNQIIVWKHPTMTKLATLTGHTLRVLYLALSPDGQTIVTGAGQSLSFCQIVNSSYAADHAGGMHICHHVKLSKRGCFVLHHACT